MKVFLGGTCAGTGWRENLISKLTCEYYNPVTDVWTATRQEQELEQRRSCDYLLYVITPSMQGVYSIAEAVDDSNKRPDRTVFCVLDADVDDDGRAFTDHEQAALAMTGRMIQENGGKYFTSLDEVADYLNQKNAEAAGEHQKG